MEAADRDEAIERLLESPMTWIGTYVAAASLLCSAGMAADALEGLWKRKLWFPSRYFSLNAASLTLLAVAMKLPVDLTTRMYTVTDRLAKISSLAFLSAAMANFLTSLGSMADKDVLSNVAALAILAVTVVVNELIQIVLMHSYLETRRAFIEEILVIVLLLLLLFMFISSAAMILSTKQYLETKFHEMHRSALNEDEDGEIDAAERVIAADKLRSLIRKHWVIAETGNPEYVIARSVTCTTSGVLALLIALVLLEAEIRMAMEFDFNILDHANSSYGWSTKLILLSQTAGVLVGAIAPAIRWFVAVKYSYCSLHEGRRKIRIAVTVEGYWTQKMVELKQSSLSLRIPNLKSRKFLHSSRGNFLQFCISVQYMIVLASKLVLLISICFASPILALFNYLRQLKRENRVSTSVSEFDIRPYVMLLEGEAELPAETLEKICREVDQVIDKGKMRKPKSLLEFLSKSFRFKGVMEFDSNRVPSLHTQEHPNCWSLPIVTLSCIALAFPNVGTEKSSLLLSSVTEGLRLVKLVDKTLDRKNCLASIRRAADVAWVRVELYHMWQDHDLKRNRLEAKSGVEVVQELGTKGEKTVMEFLREYSRSCIMQNPLNWPANVIAANSMYRVTNTILLDRGDDEGDEALFEKLCVMIADILAACLTNLGHVISFKCHRKAIEKRERSVREAALLLGETEEISMLLQQCEVPVLGPKKASSIEEWRALFDVSRV